jgi:hypothetical protein
MVKDYHGGPKREMLIDLGLYAYLRASGRSVERQFHAHLPGARKPPRIDFRVKHPNPLLIEFAVRPPHGGVQLYGSQNKSELRKLCRFNNAKAKLRALLLIDLAARPHTLGSLQASYDAIDAGRGRFYRYPVKVIYAHAEETFSFKWSPFRSV